METTTATTFTSYQQEIFDYEMAKRNGDHALAGWHASRAHDATPDVDESTLTRLRDEVLRAISEMEADEEAMSPADIARTYTIEKSEWFVPCEHELCHQLHRRFGEPCETYRNPVSGRMQNWYHNAYRYTWVILDASGERVLALNDCYYDTKREAKARLARHIAELESEVK